MFIGAGSWSTQEARAILAHWRGGRPDLATNSMGRILDPCEATQTNYIYIYYIIYIYFIDYIATTYCELHDNRPNVSMFPLLFSGAIMQIAPAQSHFQ